LLRVDRHGCKQRPSACPRWRPRPRGARGRCGDCRAQGTPTAGGRAAPAARARPGAPTDGAQRGGAIGPPVRRRNAQTHAACWAHAARRQNAHSAATREATPTNPGRPGQPVALPRSPAGRLNHPLSRVPAAATQCREAAASIPPTPPLRGIKRSHTKKRDRSAVCGPRVFFASKLPNFLARWRVRGPAGTGSVGDSVGEGAPRRGQTRTRVCQDPCHCAPREQGWRPPLQPKERQNRRAERQSMGSGSTGWDQMCRNGQSTFRRKTRICGG
jgi:hypothetical protein